MLQGNLQDHAFVARQLGALCLVARQHWGVCFFCTATWKAPLGRGRVPRCRRTLPWRVTPYRPI